MSAPQPLIPLMLTSTTHPTLPDNLLDDRLKAQQIAASQQQQSQSAALQPGVLSEQAVQNQLGQQAVQSGALQIAQQKAINDAWQSALVRGPDGSIQTDPNALTNALALSGHGAAIPIIQKGLMDMQEQRDKIAASKSSFAAAEADAAGAGAQAVIASARQNPDGSLVFDPGVKAAFLAHMNDAGYNQEAQQLQQHLQQVQSDPKAEMQVWQSLVAASPKQQALAIEKSTSDAKIMEAQNAGTRLQAELPGGALNKVTQDIAVATNPQIQAGKVQVAAAEGQARANVEAQMARGSDAALANVPPHLVAPATEAATKAGTDYAQAQSVTQRLNAMMEAAKSGNVVSYQLIPQEGALQLTTSQGVHRINMAEIQNYGGGSLWQQMQGHFGKALTGQSIPDSVLNDMAQMQKIQQQGAQSKYENTLKTINQNYGSNFKPIPIETGGPQGTGDTVRVQIPGHPPGAIPRSALQQFQQENPGAQVLQ